jgi:hypothetical protein
MGTVEGQKLQGGGFQQRQSAQAQVYLLTRGGGGDIENEEFTDMMTSTTIVG